MQFVVPVIAILLGSLFFVQSTTFTHLQADPGGPALFPQIVGAATVIGGLLLLVQIYRQRIAVKHADAAPKEPLGVRLRGRIAEIVSFLLVVSLPVTIEYLGFVPATFLFVLIVLFAFGVRPIATIITTVLVTSGIYLAYAKILGAVLPSGVLFN